MGTLSLLRRGLLGPYPPCLPFPCRCLRTVSRQVAALPGGTLKLRIPRKCDVRISPKDPHLDPDSWASALVTMDVERGPADGPRGPEAGPEQKAGGDMSEGEAKRVTTRFGLRVSVEEEGAVVRVEAAEESRPFWMAEVLRAARGWLRGILGLGKGDGQEEVWVGVEARVPSRFHVDVEIARGAVWLDKTLEGDVKVVSEKADVRINRVKSMYVDVESGSGHVIGKGLVGNVDVRTRKGDVRLDRLQGPSVKVVTMDGKVDVGAVYTERGLLRSTGGDIRIGAAHGFTNVRTAIGKVNIAGVEGTLDVESESGHVDVQLSVPKTVTVRSATGNVSMGLPPEFRAKTYLEGATGIDLSDAFTFATVDGQDESYIHGILTSTVTGQQESDDSTLARLTARASEGIVKVFPRRWMDSIRESSGSKLKTGSSIGHRTSEPLAGDVENKTVFRRSEPAASY